MLHKKLLSAALAVGVLFVANSGLAQQNDSALLKLLIKKGIITQQEAAEIQQEASAQAQAPATPASAPATAPAAPAPGESPVVGVSAKTGLGFKIGSTTFTPVGFMDFTGVYRSTTVGSGIGTSFGSIPYSNVSSTTLGPLSETRFSAQNSRIGLRVDSNVDDTKVLGYVEADFLGNSANNIRRSATRTFSACASTSST